MGQRGGNNRRHGLSVSLCRPATKYEFNNRGELSAVKHRNGGDTADKYVISYGRDAVGNPLQASFSGADVPSVYAGQTLSYSYDAISRLTGESVSGGASSSWTYDWVGNRDPGSHTYNAVDELDPGMDYAYDPKGAISCIPTCSSSPRKRFYYESSDLLAQVNSGTTGGTWETSFYWDGDDQRLGIYSPQSGPMGTYWRELYDTTASVPAVLVERQEYQDEDFNDIMLEVFYVREPGGELLASYDGTNTRYYHFDALGSTVDVTDGSGSSVGSYAYGAWGNVAGTTGATVYPYLYVGQLGYYTHASDQGAEVQSWLNLGVRFYDPEIGRFERRDPVGDLDESLYTYALNLPTDAVDERGQRGKRAGTRYRVSKPKPRAVKRPKPRYIRKPKPKAPLGRAKLTRFLKGAGYCWFAVCGAATVNHIHEWCHGDYSRNCICEAMDNLLSGLDDLWKDANPAERAAIAVANSCATSMYTAIDTALNCGARKP